jgi:hypothetical protein
MVLLGARGRERPPVHVRDSSFGQWLLRMQKLLESLTSEEERLRGLPPEEGLRGLDEEQALLALPVSVLRHLPEDYLRSLSPAVQQVVRERIARGR